MAGIDYGNGTTNIDHETGIRFGVIPTIDVGQAWYDSAEADYGDPHCPKCGNAVSTDTDFDGIEDFEQFASFQPVAGCADCCCHRCRITIDSADCFPDEAIAFTLDNEGYCAAQSGDDCDIFITKSPFYTHADFCSPCAPGACYLRSPCDKGAKAYCFGHDWFEDGKAPYPVYRVSDGSLVEP